MKIQYLIAFSFTVIFLAGCFQISSLQTAKTLPEGEVNLGVAIAAYGIKDIDFEFNSLPFDGVVPHIEIFGRKGTGENSDVGLKLSSSANIAINGKYQFFGNHTSEFAMAVGGAFEYQYSSFDNFVSRQTLSMYFSFHPNDDFALYASPKFIHQFVSDDEDSLFIGGNIGFQKRISPRLSVIGEASSFYAFDGGLIYQAGIGLTFDLK